MVAAAGSHPAPVVDNRLVPAADSHPAPAADSRRLTEAVAVVDWSSEPSQVEVSCYRGTAIVEMILSTSVCRLSSHNGNSTAMSQTMPHRPAATR